MTMESQRQVFDCQLLDTLEARPWRPVGRQRHSDFTLLGLLSYITRLTSRLPGCQTSESARAAGPLARLHKKLAAIAVVHCRRFVKFRRDMGLLYTEGQKISCHA
jgi:hypothetical protein